jgi:hypothetical protein
MPAVIAVIVFVALLKIFPLVAILLAGLWYLGVAQVIESICRAFSSCQSHYYPLWGVLGWFPADCLSCDLLRVETLVVRPTPLSEPFDF